MACNAPPAGSESPNNPDWCYTGSCNSSGGFIMDNCMWDSEHVLEQFDVEGGMVSMNYGPGQIATPLRGQRVEYPSSYARPIRRSSNFSANGNASKRPLYPSANGDSGSQSKPSGLMIILLIVVAYLIFKKK